MVMRLLILSAAVTTAQAGDRVVLVTGATGGSGVATYKLLQQQAGVTVRGLIRDPAKARQVLGCDKCDASEGIFVGDITDAQSLAPAMEGVESLVITTGISGNEDPKSIIFEGIKNQVGAFLGSPGPALKDRHVLLVSMQETTLLDTLFNKLIAKLLWGGWQNGFWSLNAEAFLMNSGVAFSIVKACGLDDTPAGQKELLAGHDDQSWSTKDVHMVSRNDVARVLAAGVLNPALASGLRFDFCARDGTPQADAVEVLKSAMYPWDPRKAEMSVRLEV